MVNDSKGAFVAGHKGLPLPPGDAAPGKPMTYDGNYRGSPVERGLKPLAALQQEIGNCSHRDLSPLPEQNVPGEVRSLIHAMNDLLARLSKALSAQQRFIADAAHQLRTPLAGLKTQTGLAPRQKELAEVRHMLQHINTATGQTTHLVNQLLSPARAEGCGLGLAIVREIAQSHNADVSLGPGAGGSGTLVTVAFSPAV